jgi:hemerythrin HHE cation binding domain-containing protein
LINNDRRYLWNFLYHAEQRQLGTGLAISISKSILLEERNERIRTAERRSSESEKAVRPRKRTDDKKRQKQIFKEIKAELEVHARIEETIFYPAMEEYEELQDMVLESLEEHKQMKTVLREMARLSPNSEKFKPKFKVLRDNVEHHAEEEEEAKMFPKISTLIDDAELEQLGEELEAANTNDFIKRVEVQ